MQEDVIIVEEERAEFYATVISYIGLILTVIGATIALVVAYRSYKRAVDGVNNPNGANESFVSVIA